jgi:inner membrane protein YhjD
MSLSGRLDRAQRRFKALGYPIAVVYKFYDDQGGYLAALVTYYGFLSLFPMLLLLTTVLGFVLHGHAALQQDLVDSALAQFPVIGAELRNDVTQLKGSTPALVVGIVVSLYGSLGVAQALQHALDKVWAVPRQARPNPLRSRLRSLGLVGLLGVGVLVTAGLSAVTTGAGILGADIGPWSRLVAGLLSTACNAGLFLLAFTLLTAQRPSVNDVWIGAIAAAVGFQLLQTVGAYYLNHRLRGASQVYGTFGLVLGLVAWIYIEAVIIVLAAEANVVRRRRLYPRSLMTPFTDNVELTEQDRQVYASYAKGERFKKHERVEVTFHEPPAPPHHPGGNTADPSAPGREANEAD